MGKVIIEYIRKSLKVLKNPKQLIPTVVLGFIWLIIALLGAFGINPLPVRILSFLTFAQGGMFGGVLGATGGILGKVVIATFLNAAIVPLFQKKAPFSGIGGGIKSFFGSLVVKSMNAVSPLLAGIGSSLLLYAFMNNTQSLQNSMVGIIAFIMLLQNIGRQGGFLWSLVFSIANSVSKGKTPSYIGASRYIGGMTLGFALSVAISAMGIRWCGWLGAAMLIASLIFLIVSKGKKEVVTIMLCCMLLLPLTAYADEIPGLTDYNNIPEGYLLMGTEDTERTVKGSNSYLLVVTEKARYDEKDYSRDIVYDFSNLPGDTYFYESKKQEFEDRNARIVQSPGVVMTFHYTDKVTNPEEFLEQYTKITDAEYMNKSSDSIPDSIKIDTIGKYKAVHGTVTYEQAEGNFQNEHWFIPLPTSVPHYGTVYLKLIVSNDVQIYGDINLDEVQTIYDQWLQECLTLTENWTNELMKFTYTVRTENLVEGPAVEPWPQSEENLSSDEEPQAEKNDTPTEESIPEESATPVLKDEEKDDESKDDKDTKDADSKKDNETDDKTDDKTDDYADPADAALISIISILMAILFGNTGGFTSPVSAGNGAPTTGNQPSKDNLSRWIKPDNNGDLECTDPVNGEKRTFVNNGDGTYTDPISGATYTPEELSRQMESRAGNADTIRQDEAKFKENVAEDSQRNKERSEDGKKLEEDLQRERQERTRKEKIERIATDLGMSGASEDEVRQELARRMERDENFRQKMNDYAQRRDTAVDILEATVEAADYGMAIGEAVVPGGKAVSATYKGIKNVGETVMEKGLNTGAVVEGVIKGGTEAATTIMDSSIGKAATTIGGTVAGEIAEAVNDGEDITRAAAEGLLKGAGNATMGAVSDAAGDAVTGGKVSDAAVKIVETGLNKEVVDPLYDEAFKKDE